MAQLPSFSRFSIEDFQGEKSWIDKLLSPLNDGLSKLIGALNNNLTHGENLLAQIATIKVSTNTAWTAGATAAGTGGQTLPPCATLITPGQIRVTMKAKPVGMVIWKCLETSTNPTTLRYGVTVDWSFANSILSINAVSGLEPAKTYILTIAIYGG